MVMFLTKSEQKLLEVLPKGVFTAKEVSGKIPLRYRTELLSRLAKRNAIQRIKKGVYLLQVNPAESQFETALGLHPDGYLGFSTALKHYGGITEELSRVFVATERAEGVKSFDNFDVEMIPVHSDFYGILQEGGLRWSTKAKTVFDCLKKPEVVGGFKKVWNAVERMELSKDDWIELLYYLENSSKSFRQKTGFLLEGKAPEWFLKKLEKSIDRKVVVRLNFGEKGFNKKWGVYHGIRDS